MSESVNGVSATAAVVLAAGQARRFGACKMALPLGGTTVLGSVLEALRSVSFVEVLVVLGADANTIVGRVPIRERIVFNPNHLEGMSTSIQAGLRALRESVGAALIVLGDQPYVQASTILRLVETHQSTRAAAVIPTFDGRRGNPVVIDRSLFPEVFALRGDTGCREILNSHGSAVVEVPVEDRGILIDIDTKEDAGLVA